MSLSSRMTSSGRLSVRRPGMVSGVVRTMALIVWALLIGGVALGQEKYLQRSAAFFSAAEFSEVTRGRVRIHRNSSDGEYRGIGNAVIRQRSDGGMEVVPPGSPLPVSPPTVVLRAGEQAIWIGTPRGAIRYTWAAGAVPVRYFAGRRWLPDDRVTGIGLGEFRRETGESEVWIETAAGYSRISEKLMTLEEKAALFEALVRARHVRHGLTADSRLTRPGDTTSNQMVSSDNDGLWTAMYVAAECFRFSVTGDPEAAQFARQGMEAIIRLEEIAGRRGFPARSFIRKGEDLQPRDGEWHDTADGLWRWKGDTSSDEIVGHYFIYPIYDELVANAEEKVKLREVITRITDHILDNDYQLIDLDGKRTLWGWWGPSAIQEDPTETGLRALHILAHLRVAIRLTGNPRYRAAYDNLITRERYHLLTRNQKINYPGNINHSDDELAFLSYYPLLRYEDDPALRKVYIESLDRAWQVERPERSPLWNFIYAAGTNATSFDREEALRTLREMPIDRIAWTVTNSHRADIPHDPLADRFKRPQALIVLPYDELAMSKWNGNPYQLDGGNGGQSEDDGASFLLPYWMGRYHRLIGR